MRNKNFDVAELCEANGLEWIGGIAEFTTSSIICRDSNGYIAPIEVRRIGRENGLRIVSVQNPFSLQNIRKYILNNNRNVRLLSDKYENAKSHLLMKCTICDHEWGVSWDNFKKRGCPNCSNSMPHTEESVFEKLESYGKPIKFSNVSVVNGRWRVDCECLTDDTHAKWNTSIDVISRSGCPECGKIRSGGKGGYSKKSAEDFKEDWIKIDALVYVIKAFDDNESFFKIGLTTTSVETRFQGKRELPYQYEILHVIKTNLYDAVIKETELHNSNKNHSYRPLKKFYGYTECFSKIDIL